MVTALVSWATPAITPPVRGEALITGLFCGRTGADFLLGAAIAINFVYPNIHLMFDPTERVIIGIEE
jgi:hypothetical protein